MHIQVLIASVGISLLFACTWDAEMGHVSDAENTAIRTIDRWIDSDDKDRNRFNIVQRTCALEVVRRASSVEAPTVLRSIADHAVRSWEMTPTELMLACVKVPSVQETQRVNL